MTQTAQLVGRNPECSAVDELLRQVSDGASGALVVRGDPGIGKSAILDYAAKAADGSLVLAVTGIESEMEVVFSGLQQTCAPMAGRLGQLPPPQADALRVAFGLSAAAAPPARFLVGLGVLGLMAEAAAARPVLCLVDDAQWIDRASLHALGFAARRLQRESVAMIFGVRAGFPVPELAGLTELALGGLTEADSRALLTAAVPGRLDERVQDRIVAEAAGNPLALLEFSHEITESGGLAGGFGVSPPWVARPLADRVAERFLARVAALPAATRRLLLLAAGRRGSPPGPRRGGGRPPPPPHGCCCWPRRSRSGTRGCCAGPGSRSEPTSRTSRRPSWRGWSGSGPRSPSGTRWCDQPSTGPRPPSTGRPRTPRWPRRPSPNTTRTGARGTVRTPPSAPTRRRRPIWSGRPTAR
jgi:hypothetical protein